MYDFKPFMVVSAHCRDILGKYFMYMYGSWTPGPQPSHGGDSLTRTHPFQLDGYPMIRILFFFNT